MRGAWLAVGLLLPAAALNYLDRQMLAAVKASVMADLPDVLSDGRWGAMLGLFKWVYAAFSPVGGYAADRLSRRWTIGVSLFVWSAVTWWTGYCSTYGELLWARSLMGVSEAFYIPAALALIADWHARPTRSRAVGLHQMAIYAGLILGGFAGYAADEPALGWRWAFAACGIAGMAYALPLTLLLRETPQRAAGPQQSPHGAARELAGNGSFWLMVLYFTVPALAAWIVRDWMPTILRERYDLGQGKAGMSASLFWTAAAIVGAGLGGWWADRWARGNPSGRIYVSAIGMLLIAPAIFGIGRAGSLAAAVGCLILFGLGWGFFDGNTMPILAQIVRRQHRATAYGVMNFVSISCGGLADWWFGLLRDRQTPLDLMCTALAAAALGSIVFVLLIRPTHNGPVEND